MRIMNFQGEPMAELDAPGCREFGTFKAATVRLKKREAEYFAVRKSLHPDLVVLYVYDGSGKLVYQKTDVDNLGHAPVLAVLPVGEGEIEKLMVGSEKDFKTQLLEYSLRE